ncbi:MAG: transcriptional regulator [Candidatus Muproteobacteria bacterium RBG_16_60_9]|uniref:Transcriptional regulator n=1 Tax=Candidatus Muproteobacteria bacterium RBG_16_60_9 TaxID=1817755 RepID=A0A1F6VBI3_9PROT|nr:MAG: transcriptional regulator [Candidatus Muproteobacteria bacterium RBG_16_60_9]
MQQIAPGAQREISVPLLDLKAQYHRLEREVLERIARVCASQQFILGPVVKEFEAEIARYSHCGHGIGVSSGTDALLVALMALDVGPGDEVITSPFTFFATGGVVARLGARPLFCDIDPVTYNISPALVAQLIETRCTTRDGKLVNRDSGGAVRVLLPVHLFGQMADMDPLMEIARRHGLQVVEDAAQAIGAEYHGRRAGSVGVIGCFSFFPSKNLGAFGDAGMCTTNDATLATRLEILRVHGGEPKYHHAEIGGNFRIDTLQAAVLSVKLKYLDDWTTARQKNAGHYDAAFKRAGIGNDLQTPVALPGYRHIYNQYVIRVKRRDALRQHLAAARIGTEVYYPIALHMQKCFAYLGYRPDDFPESLRAASEVLALPIYPELSEAQQQYVVDSIAKFYR